MTKSKDKGYVKKKPTVAESVAVKAAELPSSKKTKAKGAEPGKVFACRPCKPHPFQDRRYGSNMRVHTPAVKKAGGPGYFCTVCGVKTAL